MKHYVVYSHGFGVKKDGRGLFTDIAKTIPGAENVMIDFNEYDDQLNTLTVSSLPEQVERLKESLNKIDVSKNVVDIVAHSQGCIVAALAHPKGTRKIICLAPPDSISESQIKKLFGQRPGAEINLNGISKVPRRDGSMTIIPKTYWQSIKRLNVIKLYNRMSEDNQVRFYIANSDEILGETNFDRTNEKIEIIQIPGNHDFTDEYRSGMLELVRDALAADKF